MLPFWDCYVLFFLSADPKQRKVWYKRSHVLGEWSDGLKFGKGTAGMNWNSRDAAGSNYSAVNVTSRNATLKVMH
jgi:hypothetical protein